MNITDITPGTDYAIGTNHDADADHRNPTGEPHLTRARVLGTAHVNNEPFVLVRGVNPATGEPLNTFTPRRLITHTPSHLGITTDDPHAHAIPARYVHNTWDDHLKARTIIIDTRRSIRDSVDLYTIDRAIRITAHTTAPIPPILTDAAENLRNNTIDPDTRTTAVSVAQAILAVYNNPATQAAATTDPDAPFGAGRTSWFHLNCDLDTFRNELNRHGIACDHHVTTTARHITIREDTTDPNNPMVMIANRDTEWPILADDNYEDALQARHAMFPHRFPHGDLNPNEAPLLPTIHDIVAHHLAPDQAVMFLEARTNEQVEFLDMTTQIVTNNGIAHSHHITNQTQDETTKLNNGHRISFDG